MPSNQLRREQQPPEVLAEAAEFLGIPALAGKFLPVDRVRALYRRVRQSREGFGLEGLLAEMRVDLRVDVADAARIPATGPVVVVVDLRKTEPALLERYMGREAAARFRQRHVVAPVR